MTTLRLGVLPWRVRYAPGFDLWRERLEGEVAFAAMRGVQMLMMPEYAPLEMAAQPQPDLGLELKAACEMAENAVAAACAIAQQHAIWLLPGTLPFRNRDRIHNRAPLISPAGKVAFQDKHCMTRFESELWHIDAGQPPAVFDTDFGRIGISICYDLEFPALPRAQVEAGAWLILAPSCTDSLAGFNRVQIAARARAMENQCFLAVAPTVGTAHGIATLDENRGRAGIYGPVDRGFDDSGIVAEGEMDRQKLLIVDLDSTRLDAVRADGAVRNHRDHPAAPPAARVAVFA